MKSTLLLLLIPVLLAVPRAGGAQASATDTLRLSLEDALRIGLRSADEARLARTQVDVADAQITAARATGLPQLRLNSNYQHVLENARAQAVGSIFGQNNTYNTNAQLTQTLFQGGRVLAASRAARQVGDAVRLSEAEVRAQLAVDVQRAYLDALYAERLAVIQDSAVAIAGQRLAQVERLAEGGRAARFDVLRARVERANLEPLALRARSDRELALLELKRLLNLPMDRPIALVTRPESLEVARTLAALADSTAPAARPDDRAAVRAAELTAQARHEGVRVARADLLPTLSASATFGYLAFPTGGFLQNVPTRFGEVRVTPCPTEQQPTRTCTSQNGGWFSDRSVSLVLSWPLFDGMRTKANIELAQAQARTAEIELARTREQVAVEIAAARNEVARARAAFEAQRQTVEQAREAYDLAALRFERGLGTQLEASDAQLALLTAQINEARALYDVFLAAAELARAEGRPIPLPTGGTAELRPSSAPGRVDPSNR